MSLLGLVKLVKKSNEYIFFNVLKKKNELAKLSHSLNWIKWALV